MNIVAQASMETELEKIAYYSAPPRKRRRKIDLPSAAAAGLGGVGGLHIADKLLKPGKWRGTGRVGAAIGGALLGGEAFRSYRSGRRKRELRRRGDELQVYMQELRKAQQAGPKVNKAAEPRVGAGPVAYNKPADPK